MWQWKKIQKLLWKIKEKTFFWECLFNFEKIFEKNINKLQFIFENCCIKVYFICEKK